MGTRRGAPVTARKPAPARSHLDLRSSQCAYFSLLPFTMSKKRALQLLRDRAARACADRAVVEFADRRDFSGGAGEERFVAGVDLVARDALFDHRMPQSRASVMTVSRVMPSRHDDRSGVYSLPLFTRKKFSPEPSDT